MTGLLDRWRRRWRQAAAAAVKPEGLSPREPVGTADPLAGVPEREPAPDVIEIDMAAMLVAEFPDEFPLADAAATRVLSAVDGVDLSALARRSPALLGYDWTGYLRCSEARVVRVMRSLRQHAPPGARVLDFGSYFGNCSLACAAAGFAVEAVDSYQAYGSALAPCVDLQRAAGITIHDFATLGHDLASLHGRYDAVVCAGVIEHVPHTPRLLLETITSLLKPGGVLVLDTPNLAYLYRRLALLEGQSIFAPIPGQYFTELPFEGHHREYTVAEVEWMLHAAGHAVVSIDTFNYSLYAQHELAGEHAEYYRAMQADPSLREIIISLSRRSEDGAP